MKITAIEPQKKNPRRVNIYLDGQFTFGLQAITSAWLKVGQEVSAEKIAALKADDDRETAYQKALHFLSYRPRSSQEVRQNLAKRGCDPALVEETLDRLQRSGLVNDLDFARLWVENRSTFRPRSRSALRLELRRKGLGDSVIQSALDGAQEDEDLALETARRQARRYTGLEWAQFRSKLGAYLARRGFSYSTLAPVVSKVWMEIQMADAGTIIDNKD